MISSIFYTASSFYSLGGSERERRCKKGKGAAQSNDWQNKTLIAKVHITEHKHAQTQASASLFFSLYSYLSLSLALSVSACVCVCFQNAL